MNYADTIQRGEPPENPTKIIQASLASENKPAPAAPVAPAAAPVPTAADLNNSKSN
jgi:peptidylprolyl isomerase